MPVGDFIRARRGQVTPEQVGLPTTTRRRVTGLRREEVATLAGLNVDYFVRLEQGRERHPSTQVLAAIADALQLETTRTSNLLLNIFLDGAAPSFYANWRQAAVNTT